MDHAEREVLIVAKRVRNGERGAMSTAEQLTGALLLGDTEWLKEIGYTIPGAIERVGPAWCAALSTVVKQLREIDAAAWDAAVALETDAERAARIQRERNGEPSRPARLEDMWRAEINTLLSSA